MHPPQFGVGLGHRSGDRLLEPPGGLTELSGEVPVLDSEVERDSRRCAHAGRQLAQHVVVDQGDSDVLVPSSLTFVGVHLAKKVERGTPSVVPDLRLRQGRRRSLVGGRVLR